MTWKVAAADTSLLQKCNLKLYFCLRLDLECADDHAEVIVEQAMRDSRKLDETYIKQCLDLVVCASASEPSRGLASIVDGNLKVRAGSEVGLVLQMLDCDQLQSERVTPARLAENEKWLFSGFSRLESSAGEKGDDLSDQIALELQHRMKNIFANVQALVSQARRSQSPAHDALETLSARLGSLAKTHDVLSMPGQEGAELRAVLSSETVEIFGEERCHLAGPNVQLNSDATLAITMVVHELATNAVKYGALSNDTGTVEVSWSVVVQADCSLLELQWVEWGGPAVRVPTKEGFGSSLITMSVRHSLGGSVCRDYHQKGLRCSISLPLERVSIIGPQDDLSTHVARVHQKKAVLG